MMESSEIMEIRDAGNESHEEFSIGTGRLSRIDSSGINLQCVNTSDFTVGKQTNFNGPVTIINYADDGNPTNSNQRDATAEEIVIKEKISEPEMLPKTNNFSLEKSEKVTFQKFKMGNLKFDYRNFAKVICKRNFFKIPFFGWSLILFLVLAGCIALVIEFSDDGVLEIAEVFSGESGNYTLYTRKHWGAAEERSSVEMKLPVSYVVISSTGSDRCYKLETCKKYLRQQQHVQMKRSESDIYPNFLISSDGSVYEGRGWNKRNAFLGFVNSQSLEFSFIGDFVVYLKPSKNQTEAAKALIEFALRENKLKKKYQLIPANATGITTPQENPVIGNNLYDAIKEWPRFTPEPYLTFFSIPPLNG